MVRESGPRLAIVLVPTAVAAIALVLLLGAGGNDTLLQLQPHHHQQMWQPEQQQKKHLEQEKGHDIVKRELPDQRQDEESLLRRIDCFPEEAGGVEQLTEEACEARGCVYDPPEDAGTAPPACYVPQDDDYGYRVISGPHDTELGQRWYLQRITEWAIYDENVVNVTFDVETTNDDVVRFKVRILVWKLKNFLGATLRYTDYLKKPVVLLYIDIGG